MAFEAIVNSSGLTQTAYDTLVITDISDWDILDTADFSARSVTITNADGDTPDGFDEEIDFPLVDGLGDELEITFPTDLAITLVLTYTPLVSDPSATFTKTITTVFPGNSKSLLSSRCHKSEVAGTVRAANLSQYRLTSATLANDINSAEYEASVGNLTSAQALLDKIATADTDTITY